MAQGSLPVFRLMTSALTISARDNDAIPGPTPAPVAFRCLQRDGGGDDPRQVIDIATDDDHRANLGDRPSDPGQRHGQQRRSGDPTAGRAGRRPAARGRQTARRIPLQLLDDLAGQGRDDRCDDRVSAIVITVGVWRSCSQPEDPALDNVRSTSRPTTTGGSPVSAFRSDDRGPASGESRGGDRRAQWTADRTGESHGAGLTGGAATRFQ